MKLAQILAATAAIVLASHAATATGVDHQATLVDVAKDIAALKAEFPQLKDFSPANLDRQTLSISYRFRTHEPRPGAGWTAGVPAPDVDGVWFHLDFHDPGSTAQIHTQPAEAGSGECIGGMKVSFLIREGAQTPSLNGPIWRILRKHGVKRCSSFELGTLRIEEAIALAKAHVATQKLVVAGQHLAFAEWHPGSEAVGFWRIEWRARMPVKGWYTVVTVYADGRVEHAYGE